MNIGKGCLALSLKYSFGCTDHKTNLLVLSAMLKRLGYSAQTAEDGLAAVKAAWVRKFDLILMVNICLHFFGCVC